MTKPIKQQVMHRHILSSLDHRTRTIADGGPAPSRLPEQMASKFPLRILIAEDNVINQQVILFILQKLGYDPTIVDNGREAVDMAAKTTFDVILMDLQMPEMDGLEATKLIRSAVAAGGPTTQPAIIALTANTMEGDEDECLRAGMDDYLGKPVKLEEVIAKLQKWATRR